MLSPACAIAVVGRMPASSGNAINVRRVRLAVRWECFMSLPLQGLVTAALRAGCFGTVEGPNAIAKRAAFVFGVEQTTTLKLGDEKIENVAEPLGKNKAA